MRHRRRLRPKPPRPLGKSRRDDELGSRLSAWADSILGIACRTIRPAAIAVQDHGVILQLVLQTSRHLPLPLFDTRVHELFHAATAQAHDVIVMLALVEL